MSTTAEKTDPKLWDKVKRKVTKAAKGGKPGQWSARKAQLAVHDYKAEGGGYAGEKSADNHLVQWTEEEWGTKSGRESLDSGERYLPKAARETLSDAEYRKTTAKKRRDLKAGRQFSAQPKDIAEKSAEARHPGGDTRAALYDAAKRRQIPGRSKMTKAQLATALGRSSPS